MHYQGVVLSGTPGAGKSSLAQRLMHQYGWKKISLGDFWKESYRNAHPDGTVDFATFWRNTPREPNMRINREARIMLEHGGVVCDSRYTAAYCQDLPLLLVYIDAPVRVRAERLLGKEFYRGQTAEDLDETLILRERDEVARGKEFFGPEYDYRDSRWYDLALNSEAYTLEEEMQLIQKQMQRGFVKARVYQNLKV